MSRATDPLAGQSAPDRVRYATGMLLGADDFADEQTYHRGRLARALAYLHGSGTVAGLRVVTEAAIEPGADEEIPEGREEQLRVEGGLAIDRLGRIIELPRSACLRLDRWFNAQTEDDLTQGFHTGSGGVVVDVFVRFVSCERGRTPAFASGPFDALDAVVPSRLRDGYELSLVIRKEAEPPLPEATWPGLATEDDLDARRTALHDAILAAWREGTQWRNGAGLEPLREHAAGQNTTDVLLARLVIAASDGPPPERVPDRAVTVDNHMRPFAYTPGALARWVGVG
jgi:hypothetical protein